MHISDHEVEKWFLSHIRHTKCSALLIMVMILEPSLRASLSEGAITISPQEKEHWNSHGGTLKNSVNPLIVEEYDIQRKD